VSKIKVDDRQLSRIAGKLFEGSIKNAEASMKCYFIYVYQQVIVIDVMRRHDG
jgi:hypothetical protein